MLSSLMNQVDRELVEVTRRGTNSVLRSRGYLGLSTLNFSEITKQIQTLFSDSVQSSVSDDPVRPKSRKENSSTGTFIRVDRLPEMSRIKSDTASEYRTTHQGWSKPRGNSNYSECYIAIWLDKLEKSSVALVKKINFRSNLFKGLWFGVFWN